jgi:multimeric flavodoxin WrbA
MVTRVGRPGYIVLREDHLERSHKMGENIIKAIQTPVEERGWLGDPDMGLCPNCHGGLIFKGEPHWDGVQFPFECAVCGAGGDLVKGEDGKTRFVLAENGLCRDRNVDKCRDLHLDEIIETRIHFFQNMGEAQAKMAKYRELKFPTV